jgi:hypothetical protein
MQLFQITLKALSLRFAVLAVALLGFTPAIAVAQDGMLWDYTMGYSGGSVVRYGSLADAQNGQNALSTTVAFPQRDLNLYLGASAAVPADNFAYILTGWWPTLDGDNDGVGNPSNTNVGFTQLYDTDAGSVDNMSMYWADVARTSFTASASGSNTVVGCGTYPPQDCGRMWNGTSAANGGSFIEWDFALSAIGLDPATWNAVSGLWESASRPTSVLGSFSGIFEDATTNEYYAFHWDINQTSWAWDEGLMDGQYLYGADSTVPEPATMTLLATGLAGMAAARRRRKASS